MFVFEEKTTQKRDNKEVGMKCVSKEGNAYSEYAITDRHEKRTGGVMRKPGRMRKNEHDQGNSRSVRC